ncbi:hypothetical protein T459_16127 [Capsicum annuum]|uniref:Uncharacterized protein n=1 Tax=Capsicum annuum TaxID=4072 RepID=A0A2G2Z882_CAPAN|nr:hypothetical protein T459_16127 [Capsicum annuum]
MAPWYLGDMAPWCTVLWCLGSWVHGVCGVLVHGVMVPCCRCCPWWFEMLEHGALWVKVSVRGQPTQQRHHHGKQLYVLRYFTSAMALPMLALCAADFTGRWSPNMPPQPKSPPNNVFHPDQPTERALGPKRGVGARFRFTDQILLVRTYSELVVQRAGMASEGTVLSPSPNQHSVTHSHCGSNSSSPSTADEFGTGTLIPSPHSQSFSQSYEFILPTSLDYIVPSTKGCSPWRPDTVMKLARKLHLSRGKLQREPANRRLDWSFSPIPKSDERFARQYRYGPPPGFSLALSRSCIVYHLLDPDSVASYESLSKRKVGDLVDSSSFLRHPATNHATDYTIVYDIDYNYSIRVRRMNMKLITYISDLSSKDDYDINDMITRSSSNTIYGIDDIITCLNMDIKYDIAHDIDA